MLLIRFDSHFDRDSLSPDREWPTLDRMKNFRSKVRDLVNQVIERIPLEDNSEINYSHPLWTIIMGIEHEKIHLETTSVLIRMLPLSFIKQTPQGTFTVKETLVSRTLDEASGLINNFVDIPTTDLKIGRVHTGF